MKNLIIYCLLLLTLSSSLLAQVVVKTVGPAPADYPTLNDAFFDINNGNIQGIITLQIIDNITEPGTAELLASGGSSLYSSVTIYPTLPNLKIDGDFDGPLISLNGASNVTIDGRVNASGSTKDLVITNVNTGSSAATIMFSESAANNTIEYCIIQGSESNPNSGVIFFSTATTGTGNNGNTIDNNDITNDPAGRPVNAIFSLETFGAGNSGNFVSNNNIFNFINPGFASNGIFLSTNTTAWTISGNNFYETASFAPAASVTYSAIRIDNTSGTGFIVTGNFIGGKSAACGGSAWTKTTGLSPFYNNAFFAIYLNVGSGTASSVQNNTIKNFSWSNSLSAAWTGIHIAGGAVNIGTVTGNTIGATTGTGSITITGGASGTNVFGINIASGGTVDCQLNSIGSITASNSNSNNASNLFGINKTATAGTTTISNNIIGSTTQINSLLASSGSASNNQSVFGISTAGTGNITIDGNTISNLTNGTTNSNIATTGLINGIKSTDGTNIISDNIISDLTIANANNTTINTASVCGIALTGSTLKTISGNTISNLKNTYVSFTGGVNGLYFTGNTGANAVRENFIHSLSVTGASSTSASIFGIQAAAGATTYSNNIINMGGSTLTTIYGIYETGASGNNNNLYFNSVYIGGSPASGSNKSYALYSAVNTNTRNFRNNIFVNARSTTAGSSLHYAAYIVSSGGSLTIDYNDYFISGTGGMLGFLAGDIASLAAWKTATTQDAASVAIDPLFASPGGTFAANYQPSAGTLTAVAGTGISTDYDGAPRSIPTMGAFEIGCTNPSAGGTIAADQIGCTPFDPAVFTNTILPSGHTGTLDYKWQQSITSAVAGFTDIPSSSSSTYNPGSITQDTWYKRVARVACKVDFTGAAESNVVKATVNPLPTAGAITGGAESCIAGSISLSSNASGTPALSYTWASSNSATATVNNSGVVTPVEAGTTNITYTVTDGNTCKATSANHTVTVDPFPATGLTVGGNGVICSGSATNVSVASSVSGINYQLRNDNANELIGSVVAGNGGTIFLPTGNLTTNTTFNVLAINATTTCSAKLTQTALVSIDPPSVGGSISGTSSVTYGSSTGTMTLAGYTGIIQRWEKRFNSGSWTTISNTTATYSETASSAGIWDYRAFVKSGSCAEASSSVFSITVNKASLTITAGNKNKNYGASLPVLTVSYSGLVNGDIAPATLPTISTTATAASPVGIYPITASGASDPNYNISYVAGSLTIDKVALTITAVDKNKNYGASLPVLTVTYSGLVNGDFAPATPPSISTTATATSPAGTYPITVSGAADPNYNISYVAGTLTVDKVTLTITADNKNKNYGASLPVLTVSYSGLVNGDVAPATPPSISTTATATSPAGAYPITASGAADPNYNISYVAGTLTVDKVALTITAVNKNKNYGASLPILTVTYSGFVNGDVAPATAPTISTTATAASPVGTYPITASGAADPNYTINYLAGTLTVDKAALTITVVNKNKNYGASLPVFTVTYSGLVNGDVATATLSTISTIATVSSPVGTYPITATGAADPNYNISYVAGTLTVDMVPLTITADNKNKLYGASLPLLTVSYSGLVNGDFAPATPPSISASATPVSPVGTYPITASGAIDPNYIISYVAGTLTVDKVTLTITAVDKNKNYGASLPVFSVTYSGFVNGDIAPATLPTISTTATTASPVGTYPITASGAADPNYNISYIAGSLTINKVPLTITSANSNKNYGASLPVMTVTYSGFVNGDLAPATLPTISTTATIASPVGTYLISASGASDPNYTISYVDGTLTVNKVALIITAVDKNKNYGGSSPIFTVTYSGLVNGDTAPATLPTLSTTATTASPVGAYPITATGAADPNYNISYVAGTLTVDKAPLTVTPVDMNKNYGSPLPVLALTYSGLVNGDLAPVTLPTISTTATATSIVGTYPITATGAADPNYIISYTAGTLTVDKVLLTISAVNNNKFYGASLPVLTVTYSGFVNGDVAPATLPTTSTTATAASPVGSFPITAVGAADPNYTISYVAGTLTVDKVALTITAVNKNKNYGSSSPSFTVTYSGLVNGDAAPATLPTLSTTATSTSPVGTYPITASGAADPNYNISYVAAILNVDRAPLTITADNKTKLHLAPNPVLTYSFSGFVNAETQSVLDVLPTIQTTALQNSPLGSYPITITGGSDNNYYFIYVSGTLSITKITDTITFTSFPAKLLVGDSFTLVATATSGITVLFESMNTELATISGNNLTGVSKGNVRIRAYHTGDQDYDAAETFVTVEIYSTHRDIMHLFTPNNDGINDQWELPELAAWGKCDVRVFNRWGKLVFADANYNNLWDGTSNGSPLPEGPYYFIIKTENAGVVKGTVNIVR